MRKLALLVIFLVACRKEEAGPDVTNFDYIIFGHFYGECIGEGCVEIYKLTENNLFEDKLDMYPGSNKRYSGDFELLKKSIFDMVKDLKEKIPSELMTVEERVIGQPDAGDWGGIYFEISSGNETRFWLIDKMESNLPEYLIPFVNEIEEKIELINS